VGAAEERVEEDDYCKFSPVHHHISNNNAHADVRGCCRDNTAVDK
jgi:hypothetical protein